MRELADQERIRSFMLALSAESREDARLYFTGGATAVLLGWRTSTIDVDIKLVPEIDRLMRAIPQLKETLRLNVELASPSDFIPELPGWEDRSPFIARDGRISFHHYDPYSQALSKIERSHAQDMGDVREMLRRGLVEPKALLEYFRRIEPALYRYPAIDAESFHRAVEEVVRSAGEPSSPG